jgi:hypothetical protein
MNSNTSQSLAADLRPSHSPCGGRRR